MTRESRLIEPPLQVYSVGIIFDTSLTEIVLIHKNHPPKQAGRLNGVGGKVEPYETPCECMAREAKEECNLHSAPEDWHYIGKILPRGGLVVVHIFAIATRKSDSIMSMTREQIGWYKITEIPPNALDNIQVIVYQAKQELQNPGSQGQLTIEGGDSNNL